MRTLQTNILRALAAITYSCFILAVVKNIVESFSYGSSSWAMSDLLINYQGGFVRRGLLGEVLFQFGQSSNLPINFIAVFVALSAFCFVVIYLIQNNKNLPNFIIFSPVFIGSAAFGQFVIRKDFVLITLLILLIKQIIVESKTVKNHLLINLIIIVGTLIHEAFFFLSLGVILNYWRLSKSPISELITNLLKIPSLLPLTMIPILASGSPSVAWDINNSLIPTWEKIGGKNCCDQPGATIESLGWDVSKALSLPMSVLNDFSHGVWIPIGWLLTFLFPLFVVTRLLDVENSKKFLQVFLIQFLCFLPIFVIGWDYGRWGFLLLVSTLIIFNTLLTAAPEKREANSNSRTLWSWASLLTAMPICCWSLEIYVGSTPMGFIYFNVFKPIIFG